MFLEHGTTDFPGLDFNDILVRFRRHDEARDEAMAVGNQVHTLLLIIIKYLPSRRQPT